MLYPNNPMLTDRRWRSCEAPAGLAHGLGLVSNMGGKRSPSAAYGLPRRRCPALLGIRPRRGLKPRSTRSTCPLRREGGQHGAPRP